MHVDGVGIPETVKNSPPTLGLWGVKSSAAVTPQADCHPRHEGPGVSAPPMPDTLPATTRVVEMMGGKVRNKTSRGELEM